MRHRVDLPLSEGPTTSTRGPCAPLRAAASRRDSSCWCRLAYRGSWDSLDTYTVHSPPHTSSSQPCHVNTASLRELLSARVRSGASSTPKISAAPERRRR